MLDFHIRKKLRKHLHFLNKDIKDTIIVDEFDLCQGHSRIDMAVVNGTIHGYEIKSESDNLNRLPNQIEYYNKSLEKVTIVTTPTHLKKVIEKVPKWWGIIVTTKKKIKINIEDYRIASNNPSPDNSSLLSFLWKKELIYITEKFELISKKNLNRQTIREIISLNLCQDEITYEVREALKSRKNWRS
jgi:hypothetical protein